ncbi:VCBS repeat-containing protein [candidate division WOR-3 bacterium]|nr:VCBS repeat-containing protein [candidate division WOR-3 bacterium]
MRKFMGAIIIIIATGLYAQDWPMFQHDPSHTAFQKGQGNLQTTSDVSIRWAYHITGCDVTSQPVAGDINGDGSVEVVASSGNEVYAFSGAQGDVLWSFTSGGVMGATPPALGDINGGDTIEVIVGSNDNFVYVLSGADGSVLWRHDTYGEVSRNKPTLADIDGDGLDEVLVGSYSGWFFALDGDGTVLWFFGIPGSHTWNSPAVGDLDNDGDLEVVIFTRSGWVFVLNGLDGSPVWKRRLVEYPGVYEGQGSPSLGDLDGDFLLEIVIGTWSGVLYVLDGQNGNTVWSHSFDSYCLATPVIVDIDDDDLPEVVVGAGWGDEKVYCFKCDGNIKWTASFPGYNPGKPSCSAADINGDGDIEILVAAEVYSWVGGLIAALDKNGNELWRYENYPQLAVNWSFKGPTIADVTGDGNLDIIWGTAIYPGGYYDGYVLVITKDELGVEGISEAENSRLFRVGPNPSSEGVKIAFSTERAMDITLRIYDFAGRLSKEIHNGILFAGEHIFRWEGNAGIYFVVLDTPDGRETEKVTLLK